MAHRILVIDHHPQGLQRMVNPLRKAGYEVDVAQTAADGASEFGRIDPDLVLIAARLPRTHGTVLCRELKRTESGAATPIVLIVEGAAVQIDLPPLDHFGADRLLPKPFGSDDLLRVCRELLESDSTRTPQADPRAAEGLSTELQELDVLDLDLPRDVPHERGASATSSVPLSTEQRQDIEDRIDDLFSDKSTPPEPLADPEPSTGRDADADSTVLDELDIDDQLEMKLNSRPTSAEAQPQVRRPSVTATAPPPLGRGGSIPNRFQTEALTRESTAHPAVTATREEAGFVPPRWSWIAISVTVAIVALAVFVMSNRAVDSAPQVEPASVPASPAEERSTGVPPESWTTEVRTSQASTPDLAWLPPVEPVPAEADPTPVAEEPVAVEADPTPVAEEPVPVEADPTPVAEEPVAVEADPTPVAEEPVPAEADPTPVAEEPVPAEADPTPVAEEPVPAEADPTPVAEEPVAVEADPTPVAEEPVPAEADPTPVAEEPVPAEADPTPVAEEPVPAEADPTPVAEEPVAVETDPTPVAVEPEPLTRKPILMRHVQPEVSSRDLKKGGGTVLLKVFVAADGAVTRVLVEQGLPGSPLEAAAVAAVLRWHYEPALERGRPVGAWTTARFTFDE